jgi:L-rhamnose isomerase/sugar isomerase
MPVYQGDCMTINRAEAAFQALNNLRIELPSWGFADTGTRFGKFLQTAAASTIEEKFADAGQVHALTGACPTVALHVLWDLPQLSDIARVEALSARYGVRPGSINPNIFQDQCYKYGSLANENVEIREHALRHILDCVAIANKTGSRDLAPWIADGSSYPGTANIRRRKQWLIEGLKRVHDELAADQRLLIEYKPFEPFFYHTDIADWGMAFMLAKHAGPKAKVLVDTGHHYLAQNIEQIVAWLLSEDMLGGFHFNDRRYADDDLTLGSIDPYQIFRVFAEIHHYEWEAGGKADIAYMVDQSHNLKGKIEAMIQTVMAAQELYAKAALIDHERLEQARMNHALIDAENCYTDAFNSDVRPIIRDWRLTRNLPADPLEAFRSSGYLETISAERGSRKKAASSYA